MALNQVIHGSNRVVENPNRYRLNPVAGQSNTYDLEKQPGVITDNGTPYNKLILDKIDNVLSYLTPSMEKVEHIDYVNDNINICYAVESITNVTGNNVTYDKIEVNYTSGNIVTPKLTIKGVNTTDNKIRVGTTIPDNMTNIIFEYNNNNYYDKTYLINILKQTAYNNYNYLWINSKSGQGISFEFDFIGIASGLLHTRVNVNNMYKIQASNDKENWVDIQNLTANSDLSINFNNYRYVRLYSENVGTNFSSIFYLYFSDLVITNIEKTTYQNQFTLDNNTSFTNNQRVLIETDKNIQEIISKFNDITIDTINNDVSPNISTQYTSFDMVANTMTNGTTSITPTINITSNSGSFVYYYTGGNNAICCSDRGSFGVTNSSFLKTFLALKNETANNIIRTIKDINFVYDFKIPVYSKAKIMVSCNKIGVNYTLYGSNDGLNYETLLTYTTVDSSTATIEYSTLSKYRYIKFVTPSSSNISDFDLLSIYDIGKEEEIEMPYDVESNTLNGIDISTLLHPSTKYELIYDETNNKFDFGNLTEKQPLFDITLTENVSQIDINGLLNKLEFNKIYAIIFNGKLTSSSNITLGLNNSNYIISQGDTNHIRSPFIFSKVTNEIIVGISIGNGISVFDYSIYGIEKLIASNFSAGTRIIIKEVA